MVLCSPFATSVLYKCRFLLTTEKVVTRVDFPLGQSAKIATVLRLTLFSYLQMLPASLEARIADTECRKTMNRNTHVFSKCNEQV